jgi:hypothetical protein
MARYEFKPIVEESLPEVAAFLFQQQELTSREDSTQARPAGDDLRWMLDNPHLRADLPHGLSLWSPDGKIVGMILAVPRLYRLADRRLLGLAAGDFFVDSSARLQGFFMLRRFLSLTGVDFWYANSCNRQSGPLWAKCGAIMVAESDVEYLFPLRLGPIAEELALRKGWPLVSGRLLRGLGPAATLIAAPRIPKNRFAVEYCTEIDRLAEIADRDRNPLYLEPERSAAYLKWVYGSLTSVPGEKQDHQVFSFHDNIGREGWFALRHDLRGRLQQIRTARLTDVVWPGDQMEFIDVLPAILEVARPHCDLVSIRGRVGLGLKEGMAALRRRSLLAPEGFVVGQSPASAELAKLADFPFADRY